MERERTGREETEYEERGEGETSVPLELNEERERRERWRSTLLSLGLGQSCGNDWITPATLGLGRGTGTMCFKSLASRRCN